MPALETRRRVRRGRLDERGQVAPALVAALVGGLAIALVVITLGRGLDQTARAVTASDAAALAVAKEHQRQFVNSFGVDGGPLADLPAYLNSWGPVSGAERDAADYADANGADVQGQVDFEGYDAGEQRWVYGVRTKQRDPVSDDSDKRAENVSKAEVKITEGLCAGGTGIDYNGTCVTAQVYEDGCEIEEPPPPPPPDPSASPTETPEPPDPPEPAAFCDVNLAESLEWKIRLTK